MTSKFYKIRSSCRKRSADTTTPVSLYLKLRAQFPSSLLLESADYRGSENSWSFICLNPIAEFSLFDGSLKMKFPNGETESETIRGPLVSDRLQSFINRLIVEKDPIAPPFMNGVFGYISYDAIPYFEDIEFRSPRDTNTKIPDINYRFFQFVIGFNHFNEELYILENRVEGASSELKLLDQQKVDLIIQDALPERTDFTLVSDEKAANSEQHFLQTVEKCKEHILRGDIFQIVPSRRFARTFEGDDFRVYRALRSINPSPYLFYFDYDDFKIFGSSPEAQLVIRNGKATIFPIAGTYRRTGDEISDQRLAETLASDPKENAEHVMLVDLGRNDLSRNCENVKVEVFREVQFYSHVIHLVSKVSGEVMPGRPALKVLGDSFPAGTLSGAPKYKAMQLIDAFEGVRRSYYGGAIGIFTFDGGCNHAITIRSFLSQNNTLTYQAGAGVVLDSVAENELREIDNKLSALRRAMNLAEELE